MARLTNRQMGSAVSRREPFTNSKGSAFGRWEGVPDTVEHRYVAYSYGKHFPMYVWTCGQWFGNADKYSQSTGRHMSTARPSGQITYVDTGQMRHLADGGLVGVIRDKFRQAA